MPDIFKIVGSEPELEAGALAMRLGLAMVFGLVIAGVFALSQKRTARETIPMITTLVLLTMLVAMTTIVIGDSVARAFGLVGALSIVRFRTVVEDTRDTSFVIFAVVTGMAMGAGHLIVCIIGVPLVSLIAVALGAFGRSVIGATAQRLEIRIGAGRDPSTMFNHVFDEHLARQALHSVVSARQGASIDVIYRVRLKNSDGMFPLLKAIQSIEGVQSVDLRDV